MHLWLKISQLSLCRFPPVCYPPDILNGITEPSSPLQPGEKLQILCDEGFSLNLMSILVCQEDGTFGDRTIPECIGFQLMWTIIRPEMRSRSFTYLFSCSYDLTYQNIILIKFPDRRFSWTDRATGWITAFGQQRILSSSQFHHTYVSKRESLKVSKTFKHPD
jgi:hypothetical protein